MTIGEEAHTKALVTGASSGIGAALARQLAARGVEVWLCARREERLEAEVAAIRAQGGRAHALRLDVSAPEETAARLLALDEEVSGLDLVIANAGVGDDTPAARGDWQTTARIFQTNVVGAAATLLPLVPRMIERGRGHLVGISSLAGELPLPRGTPYGASKAALTYLLEGTRMELSGTGVAVTIVHPGFVTTEMTAKNDFPMPFLLDTERAARIIDRGIQRQARLVRFPLPLAALIRVARLAPAWLREAVIRRAAG